jgi:UDP-N-acetylglucosamine transferase subunit ALG13
MVELGKHTVLVPRRAARGEHIDDHQVQVCRDFEARGLVIYREVENISSADMQAPAGLT